MRVLASSDPLTGPTWLTAIFTGVLAIGAIVTAVFAIRAFGKQSAEVRTLEGQAKDQQELTRQQGELLKVQSGQLELQREQLGEQRTVNEKQTAVLELQADELRASIEQREREAAERHRAQALRVFMWEERFHYDPSLAEEAGEESTPVVVAHVRNASDQPIYELRFSWHRGTAPYRHGEAMRPVMPHDDAFATCALPDDLPHQVDPGVFGAVAFFRDAAGTRWRARPDGQLDEIPPGQEPPHTW